MGGDFSSDLWYQRQRKIVAHAFDQTDFGTATALANDLRGFQATGGTHQRVFVAVQHQRRHLYLPYRARAVIACGNRQQLSCSTGRVVGSQNVALANFTQMRGIGRMGPAANRGEHPHHAHDCGLGHVSALVANQRH